MIYKMKIKTLVEEDGDSPRVPRGIPQYFGIFYALGLALCAEGVMSGLYHVCPTDENFQFDTTFMYVTAILLAVKLYQFR